MSSSRNRALHRIFSTRIEVVAALRARVALMSDDERQAWAAGTSVAEVQAERARRERLVSDGAAG